MKYTIIYMLLIFKQILNKVFRSTLIVFMLLGLVIPAYSNYLYNVSIDNILVNTEKEENYNDIILSDKDSIKFNFSLEGFGHDNKDTYMYKIVLRNSAGDSAVKTIGVSNCIYSRLSEDRYEFFISAFDVSGKWVTNNEIVQFEVNNRTANLIAQNKKLLAEKHKSDSLLSIFENKPAVETSYFSILYIIISAVIVVLIFALLYLLMRSSKRNKMNIEKLSNMEQDINEKEQSVTKYGNETSELLDLKSSLESTMGQINLKVDEIMYINESLVSQLMLMNQKDFELQELQKNKNTVFANILTRGIKEPVASIKSLIELLRSYDLNANETKDIIAYIVEATQKIITISEDIQRYSDVETESNIQLNCENINIKSLLDEVLSNTKVQSAEKQININYDIQPNLDFIYIDYSKILFVLRNLISYDVKSIHNTGNIKISCTYNENKTYILFEIKDDSNGLSEEELKYFSVEDIKNIDTPINIQQLNFSKIKRYIEAHNGVFQVSSILGEGTTFSFQIPVNREA